MENIKTSLTNNYLYYSNNILFKHYLNSIYKSKQNKLTSELNDKNQNKLDYVNLLSEHLQRNDIDFRETVYLNTITKATKLELFFIKNMLINLGAYILFRAVYLKNHNKSFIFLDNNRYFYNQLNIIIVKASKMSLSCAFLLSLYYLLKYLLVFSYKRVLISNEEIELTLINNNNKDNNNI